MSENRQQLYRNSIAAVFGTMISLECLAWGAVTAPILAIGILSTGVLYLISRQCDLFEELPSPIQLYGQRIISGFFLLILLQWLLSWLGYPSADLHPADERSAYSALSLPSLFDHTQWFEKLGRCLFTILTFLLAIEISHCKQASRTFLSSLLFSATICVAATFLITTPHLAPIGTAYIHGFVNPNHVAIYLGIMLLVCFWRLHFLVRRIYQKHTKGVMKWVGGLNSKVLLQLVLILFSIVLFSLDLFITSSRGGIILSMVAISIFIGIIFLKKGLRKRKAYLWVLRFMGVLIIAGIFATFFSYFGGGLMIDIQRHGVALDDRRYIFAGLLHIILDYPLIGIGLGGFESFFHLYRPEAMMTEGIVDKAHNTYLEIAGELGLAGFALCFGATMLLGITLLQNTFSRRKHYGLAVLGLSTWILLALHSLIDFPTQIPSLAALGISVITICAIQSTRHGDFRPRTTIKGRSHE